MSSFTQEWYYAQQLKRDVPKGEFVSIASVRSESALHESIAAYCKAKGWYYVHSRLDKKSTNGVGTPDYIIACNHGITLWIECKAKGGKVRPEQLAAKCFLQTRGHKASIVWSMEEFLEIVKGIE